MTQPPRHHYSDPALDGAGPTVVPDDLYASPPPWDIVAAFADGWRVDALDAATIEVTTDADGIPAWLLALARI
jgi:hypothetical protein